MRTTAVVWSGASPLTDEQQDAVRDAAEALAGPEYREGRLATTLENGDKHVIREWPDLATAEAWIPIVNGWNPISAVVNPE
jgi:hypothetical protein